MKHRNRKQRQEDARQRGFAAINRVRRGQSKTLSAAAWNEGTTVRSIRQYLPAALIQGRPGGRIRVKAGDPYSAWVQITTNAGPLDATARGSRQRELAGRHRSVVNRVLGKKLPPSALEQFRGARVGGYELISDPDLLFTLANRGVLDQLDILYVSPETRG